MYVTIAIAALSAVCFVLTGLPVYLVPLAVSVWGTWYIAKTNRARTGR